MNRNLSIFSAILFGIACTPGTQLPSDGTGKAGGACYSNRTCDAGLVCYNDECIGIAKDEGQDAGTVKTDAGEPNDLGKIGGACFANGTCDDGLTCENGVCGVAAYSDGGILTDGGSSGGCDQSLDGDCDGFPTPQDCDDADPLIGSNQVVEFTLQNAFTRTPANVTLFFRATECGGDPISNLPADAFTVREDGNTVSVFESGQTLLPTSLGFARFSLLLLDMSGSTIASGALPSLLSAAEAFVDATVQDGGSHRVSIQLFDGRALPIEVIDYTNDLLELQAAIDGLADYTVVDSSTNLNGAVIAALADVDARLSASQAGAKASALVVFTDGTDQTGRATTAEAVAAVNASPSAVFTVGLGGELDIDALQQIGKSGAEFAAQQSDIVTAFETIGAALERAAGGYYILSYCSPKRAGTHVLTVEVDGRPGQLSYTFNAEGFTQGCTPAVVSNPCAGRSCGVIDGIVCGMCSTGETCDPNGQCLTPGCAAGTHSENGECVANTRDCVVLNGEGEQSWNGNAWGACTVTECDAGYRLESGSCVEAVLPRDCHEIWQSDPNANDGQYEVDPDGPGGEPAFDVFCDMTTEGAGWTLVARYKGGASFSFDPLSHQDQLSGATGTPPALDISGSVFGHLKYSAFDLSGKSVRMDCGVVGSAPTFSVQDNNTFDSWEEGDKGTYGANLWGTFRWTTQRSRHFICGNMLSTVEGGGIGYCSGPGVSNSYANHLASFSAYAGVTTSGTIPFPVVCDGALLSNGELRVWVR